MKKLFLILLSIIICGIYVIPCIIITIIAIIFRSLGINEDITNSKIIIFIIKPITYLEKLIKQNKTK